MTNAANLVVGLVIGCVIAAILYPREPEPKTWPKLMKKWWNE